MALPPTFVSDFHDESTIRELKYSRLGGTDLVIPKLTFGCSALGSVFRATDDNESVKVTEAAIKAGLNMIDTAPWYGHGKSETVLGKLEKKTTTPEELRYISHAMPGYRNSMFLVKILPKLPRKAFYLNTKVGRYEADYQKMFDFRAERVMRSVDESLQRLGLDYVDIIQVHDMEFAPSLDIIVNETLPALQKLKESGKVRYIGITGYPLENFRRVIERSTVKIDTVLTYCHGSMNDNSLQDFLPFLHEQNVGVINASLLSMGLLTNRGPSSWHPAGEEIREACRAAAECCQNRGVDISKIATRYALVQPGIDTTLISTASMANLEKNLEVLKHGITELEQQISDEVMEKFFKPLENANWDGVEVANYWKNVNQSS